MALIDDQKKGDRAATLFRRLYPVGTPVLYHPVKPFNRATAVRTKIASAPWVLGHGAAVVAVEGRGGGVALDHIEPDHGR